MAMLDEERSGLLLARLSERFGTRLSLAASVREQHAGIEGHYLGKWPDAVLMPTNTNEITEAVKLCRALGAPIIPHGAGTSLEGHLSAEEGGISIDLTAMNRILEIDADNMLCRIEAGVTREQLNHELRDRGLFFPIDPGANATLGGMASTRASGTNAVRYGTMRDNVLSLEIVLADGSIVETGTKAAKSSAGYDLTALFVGSEGTLGIITAVSLRLHPIPQSVRAATVTFEGLEEAVRTVISAIQMGIPLARIELLDSAQIAACNAYSRLELPVRPTLFLEFHGSDAAVAEDVACFEEVAMSHGGASLTEATKVEDRNRLWKARHDAYFATKGLRPGASVWSTDVCVPIAHLAESILATRKDIESHGLLATIVGHVGDGNYHVLFVLDPERPGDRATAAAVNQRMVDHAIALGGTCTGEHGIGMGKRECLIAERGLVAVEMMHAIKQALDPAGLMNPGKIFLSADGPVEGTPSSSIAPRGPRARATRL